MATDVLVSPPATTPDVSAPPHDVTAVVARLDELLDRTVPARTASNVLIATWNLRAFADLTKDWQSGAHASPRRNFADVTYIATILGRFDVVALQEVHGNLRALRYTLKALGDDWGFIMTDVTKGPAGNDERLAFLFDTKRVKPSGLACELVVPVESDPKKITPGAFERQFARTPYAVSFVTAAGQTFILVTLHVEYGDPSDRVGELKAIAEWLAAWAEQEYGWNQNLIVEGDFNIDRAGDPLYDAFTSTGLVSAPQLNTVPRTIFDTPKVHHFYDQIAWFAKGEQQRPVLTLPCRSAGTFDFVSELQAGRTLQELSWHISDHFPLWVELAEDGG